MKDPVVVEQPAEPAEPAPKPKSRRGMSKPITDQQREHLAKARERAAEAQRAKAELTRLEKIAQKQS